MAAVACPLAGCFAAPPQIVSLNPARGAGTVAADAAVTVMFDHPVAFSSLRGRLSVQPTIHGCDLDRALMTGTGGGCAVRPVDGSRGFRIDHEAAIFAPDTVYTFRLSGGVEDAEGVVNSVDHSWSMVTAAAPAVRAVDPDDGSEPVPLDAAMTVSFSTAMREESTAAAISLEPAVDGTRVSRSAANPDRFLLQPGRLLEPGTWYQVTVARSATDEHGQHLGRTAVSRFRAGGLSPGSHAVVLSQRSGEAVSEVTMTILSSAQAAVPPAALGVLTAPRCPGPPCGPVAPGMPMTAYLSANLSPQGGRLAVVEADLSSPGAPLNLRVMDLVGNRLIALIPGGDGPVWSPDGRLLEYSEAGRIRFLAPDGGEMAVLAAGPPPTGRPVWMPDGDTMVIPTVARDSAPRLELSTPRLGARYAVPGLGGEASDPAVSPSGRLLAFRRPASHSGGPSAEVIDLAGGRGVRRLGGDLRPLAFLDEETILALRNPGSPTAQLVEVGVGSGDVSVMDIGPGAQLQTIAVSSGRGEIAVVARDQTGAREVFVATPQGAHRRQVTALSRIGLQPTSASLN
ncbi:MAG: Ig-like domain-containing protein [Candidatus Dormibacteria bacterium]